MKDCRARRPSAPGKAPVSGRASPSAPEKRALVTSHIPMGRAGDAEEMAAVTTFLLSDEAAYITGQTLFVDGGFTPYADFRGTWSSE
jgi:glucose 1-dehydrogenase